MNNTGNEWNRSVNNNVIPPRIGSRTEGTNNNNGVTGIITTTTTTTNNGHCRVRNSPMCSQEGTMWCSPRAACNITSTTNVSPGQPSSLPTAPPPNKGKWLFRNGNGGNRNCRMQFPSTYHQQNNFQQQQQCRTPALHQQIPKDHQILINRRSVTTTNASPVIPPTPPPSTTRNGQCRWECNKCTGQSPVAYLALFAGRRTFHSSTRIK